MEEKVKAIYGNPFREFSLKRNNASITIEILKILQEKNLSVTDAQEILSDAIKILPQITYFV